MAGIEDRGKANENKFAHDSELEFKANARRNKLVGVWAAELMGLEGDAVSAYAKEVIIADFEEKGDDDVLRKLHRDFEAKNVEMSVHRIRREMDELLIVARSQVHNEA